MTASQPPAVDDNYPPFSDFALRYALEWQSARLARQLNWANVEQREALGEDCRVFGPQASLDAETAMRAAMDMMTAHSPTSVAGVRAVLAVVAEMLALRKMQPEDDWFEGDALQLVINANRSLGRLDGATKLGAG